MFVSRLYIFIRFGRSGGVFSGLNNSSALTRFSHTKRHLRRNFMPSPAREKNDLDGAPLRDPIDRLEDECSDGGEGCESDGNYSQGVLPGYSKHSSRMALPNKTHSYFSDTRFDQSAISPLSLKAIKDAGYEHMTIVQEKTLPIILNGKDVVVKAITGTGKTVAFLVPLIEVIARLPPPHRDQRHPPITALIICPTRELAIQSASVANVLLKHHTGIGVQVVIGGTRLPLEQKQMKANPRQILVATIGRLKDHIENTPGFRIRLKGVRVLVLDEADLLMEMGFRPVIEKILTALPKQRQTLLFSAAIPEEVRKICHTFLRRDHEIVNVAQKGCEEIPPQVKQMYMVAPLDKHFSLLYALLKDHISDDADYKVIMFCSTSMMTRLVADLLGELHLNVRETHSKKSSDRTRIWEEFRKEKGLILVTSDISSRGVDYPDVTLVLQVGVPSSRHQYVTRLGRTGRNGKKGKGVLLLAPWEEFFLLKIKDFPMSVAPIPTVSAGMRRMVEKALSRVEVENKEAAYAAWLGYYSERKEVGCDKWKLVELSNEFGRSMGLDNPPAMSKFAVARLDLKYIPGLRVK